MDVLSRKEREKLSRREAIIKAAAKVFAQKGFHGATLEEIAEEAEFSKAALYLYFRNKSDLFVSTFQNGVEKVSAQIDEAISETADIKARLKKIVRAILNFVGDNKNFFKLMFEQRLYKEEEIDDELKESKIKFLGLLNKYIGECLDAGLLKSDYSIGELSSILFGIISAVIWYWMYAESDDSLADKCDMVMDIFWNGAGV